MAACGAAALVRVYNSKVSIRSIYRPLLDRKYLIFLILKCVDGVDGTLVKFIASGNSIFYKNEAFQRPTYIQRILVECENALGVVASLRLCAESLRKYALAMRIALQASKGKMAAQMRIDVQGPGVAVKPKHRIIALKDLGS